MKKLVSYLVMLLCMILINSNSSLNAQQPIPCNPDCEAANWINKTIDMGLQGCNKNCYVRIYYSYRIACNTWQDVQVTKVVALTKACDLCSIKDLYLQAYFAIITANQMGFNPKNGTTGCSSIWRVTPGGCLATWKILVHDPTHEVDTLVVLQKCESEKTPCCLASMKVCRTVRPGKPDSVYIGTSSNPYPAYDCSGTIIPKVDTLPPAPDGTKCLPMCDWFKDVVYNSAKSVDEVNDNIAFVEKPVFLYPNPTTNLVKLDLNSPDNANIEINIYDMQQRLVKSETRFVRSGWNSVEMNVSELNAGNYTMHLSSNGVPVHNFKLEVIR